MEVNNPKELLEVIIANDKKIVKKRVLLKSFLTETVRPEVSV